MNSRQVIKIFRPLCVLFLLTAAKFALARTTGQIDVTIPGVPSAQNNPGAWVGGLYQFSLMAAGLLAFGVIVYAGLRYTFAAGNPSTQSDARDQILQALLGVLLLLGAYIVLTTINPGLINLGLPGLRKIEVTQPATSQPSMGTQRAARIGVTGELTDAEAKLRLAPGIAVKSGKGAASLENIQSGAIDEVNNLRKSCPLCTIMITAGTDGIHAGGTFSHANGYKIDLRTDSVLNSYITKNFKSIGTRNDGAPQFQAPNGAIYAKESDHWDILVKA